MTNPDIDRIKRKILGVRMQSARTMMGLNPKELAEQLGIPVNTLTGYEFGQQEASLPELEALAQVCNLPISFFLSNGSSQQPEQKIDLMARRKRVGAALRALREEAGHTQDVVGKVLGYAAKKISNYELAKQAIPFGELEKLADFYQVPVSHFFDPAFNVTPPSAEPPPAQSKPEPAPPAAAPAPAAAAHLPTDMAWLADAPDDIKKFLSDPASMLYLRLSMRLHNLSADTLRTLAEGILDITY